MHRPFFGLLWAFVVLLCACSATPGGAAAGSPGAPPAAAAQTARWTIAPTLADCVGVGPMQCMRYRDRPDGQWLFFYGAIEGFTFREGEEADILVRFITVPNPPADGSSRRVVLVQELARRPAPMTSSAPSAGATPAASPAALTASGWQLASMGSARPATPEFSRIRMSIDAAGRASGHSGVNRFSAQTRATDTALRFEAPVSTRMAGSPEAMALESDFLARLLRTASGRIEGDRLRLFDAGGAELMSFSRAAAAR